jgi:hypothetical protein
LSSGVARALHSDEIPIDAELVQGLVRRAMPAHADAPVRRLASSGSTNALFRVGDELLVRLPRQPGGSASISKEVTWLPVLGPLLPVAVPEVVAVFEPDHAYPERWSVVRWMVRTLRWSTRTHPSTHNATSWPTTWPRSWTPCGRRRYPLGRSITHTCTRTEASRSRRWIVPARSG